MEMLVFAVVGHAGDSDLAVAAEIDTFLEDCQVRILRAEPS